MNSYQKRVECKYGCENMLYWDTDEGFYRNDEDDERHICPNFSSHNPTTKSRDSIIKCKNEGCGIQLFWKKGERQPYEKDTGIKHICKAWIDKQNALHGTGSQAKLLLEQQTSSPQITRTEEVIKTSPTLDQYSETNVWLRGIMDILREIRDNMEVNNKYTKMLWEEMKTFTETEQDDKHRHLNPLAHLSFKEHQEEADAAVKDDIYDEIADTDDQSRDV